METQHKIIEAISIGITILLIFAGTAATATEHSMQIPMNGLEEKRLGTAVYYNDNDDSTGDSRSFKVSWTEKLKLSRSSTSLQLTSAVSFEEMGAAAQLHWSF